MSKFEMIVKRLPVEWEGLLSMGLDHLFEHLGPDEVDFAVYDNGVAIEMKLDEEGIEEAVEFWEEHVEDKMNNE